MPRNKLLIAALVVVFSNLFALARVGMNRSGEPEATLPLTERELRPTPQQAENTAMTLRLVWTDPAASAGDPGWFDAAKLSSIGFNCRLPVTEENAAHYRVTPPRSTYAVLEFDGAGWQRYVAAPRAAGDLSPIDRESRLVVVDVGNDPRALRARYPDRTRTVVVPATAALSFVREGGRPPFLRGRVTQVFPLELNVPRQWRTVFERPSGGMPVTGVSRPRLGGRALAHDPQFRVTVAWGRSLEPWIADVRPLPAATLAK